MIYLYHIMSKKREREYITIGSSDDELSDNPAPTKKRNYLFFCL